MEDLRLKKIKDKVFKISGYTVLDTFYKDENQKLTCIDKNGYKYYVSYDVLRHSKKSRKFTIKNPYTVQNIKLWMSENAINYKFLSTEYKGNNIKYSFVCPKNHHFNMTWSQFEIGHRCQICANENRLLNGLLFEEFKNKFENKCGFIILDDKYNGCKEKYNLMDSMGYKYYTMLPNVERGLRKVSANNPYSLENVKLWLSLHNDKIKLLSKEYKSNGSKNRDDKLEFICDKGHIFKMSWSDVSENIKCPKCSRRFWDEEGFLKYMKNLYGDEYTMLGSYVNSSTPVLFRHNKCGNEWFTKPAHIANGHGCNNRFCCHARGENHYKWKSELTDEDRKKNLSRLTLFGYKDWRIGIFIKYENKCVVCGNKTKKDNKIVAHHLNSWNNHKDERFDINNGVAICEKHHIEFHSKYGYGDNTKEQFKEYLSTYKINNNIF